MMPRIESFKDLAKTYHIEKYYIIHLKNTNGVLVSLVKTK